MEIPNLKIRYPIKTEDSNSTRRIRNNGALNILLLFMGIGDDSKKKIKDNLILLITF